jgi:hypothetical protein
MEYYEAADVQRRLYGRFEEDRENRVMREATEVKVHLKSRDGWTKTQSMAAAEVRGPRLSLARPVPARPARWDERVGPPVIAEEITAHHHYYRVVKRATIEDYEKGESRTEVWAVEQ